MNFTDYQPRAIAFASFQPTTQLDTLHGVLGMVSEAGEISECLRDHSVYGKLLDRKNLVGELGDFMWFATLTITVLGASLNTLVTTLPRHLPADEDPTPLLLEISCSIADKFKAPLVYGKPLDSISILESIANAIYLINEIAERHDYEMVEILDANIAKLTARYGDKFSAEKALNRNTDAEFKAIEAATT